MYVYANLLRMYFLFVTQGYEFDLDLLKAKTYTSI
jgi:hypothetical protein